MDSFSFPPSITTPPSPFIHNPPPHNNPLSFLPICNCPRYFPAIFIIRTESPVNVVHALFKIAPPGTKIGFQETREGDNFSLNDLTILPPFLPTFGYTSVHDRTRGYHPLHKPLHKVFTPVQICFDRSTTRAAGFESRLFRVVRAELRERG